MTMKPKNFTQNNVKRRSGLALLAGLSAAIFLSAPSHAGTITVVNGDFSSNSVSDAEQSERSLEFAGVDAGWASGFRGGNWDLSSGAAQMHVANRALALFQTMSVGGSTAAPTDLTLEFDVEILSGALSSLEGLVEIYTWDSAGITPTIAVSQSDFANVYANGNQRSATLALSGEATIATAGVLFIDDKTFITANGLNAANTTGTFSKSFTLAAGHDRAAIVFSVENEDSNDFATKGLQIDNVTIVPEPGTLALAGFGGLMMLRRRRS